MQRILKILLQCRHLYGKHFSFKFIESLFAGFFSGRFSKFSVHRRKSKIGSSLQKSFSWPWNSVIYTYLYCEHNPLQWKMKRSWKEYELLSFSFSFDVSYILVKGEASKEWSRLCFFWQFTSCPPMVVSWFFFIRVFHSSVCK